MKMKNVTRSSSRFPGGWLPRALLCLVLSELARANIVQYWDPEGIYPGNTSYATYTNASLAGIWESSSWSSADIGQPVTAGWVEDNAACFAVGAGTTNSGDSATTTAFTVTMNQNHTIAGIFDGNLNPNSCIVTINGGGIWTIPNDLGQLQGFGTFNNADGSLGQIIINVVLAGPGTLTPEGNGQLFLNATNTWTGGTQLGFSGSGWFGIIWFNNSASFGTGGITNFSSGSALVAEGSFPITIPNNFDFSIANSPTPFLNLVGNPAGVTFSGNWNLATLTTFRVGSGGAANSLVSIAGVMSGSAGLSKFNNGILRLAATNTFTGPTVINAGTLEIQRPGGLASTSVTVATGAMLQLDSSSALNSATALLLQTGSPVVNLNYTGADSIAALSFDGGTSFVQAGTYGPAGSGAPNTDPRLTGTGLLNVGVVCSQTNRVVSLASNGSGSYTLNLQGTYNAQYSIVSQTNPTLPMVNWALVPGSTTLVSNPSGAWSFTVTNPAPAFYRSKAACSQ